jgi:peroxiredoxin/outer membrane protein assembly factor BamD (BamD/ComL family)
MRLDYIRLALLLVLATVLVQRSIAEEKPAPTKTDGPTDEKAQKTYNRALELLHDGELGRALDGFRKADKQDGGHCLACQIMMIKYAVELGEWKTAELAAQQMVAEAQGKQDTAIAHHQLAVVFMDQGLERHKDEFFTRAHEELTQALAAYANFPDAVFLDGQALAHLQQDDAAKARFEQFAKMEHDDSPNRQRALRYITRPELARARMAPAFAVTTIEGKRISMDDLQGKVVLLDFWATWCAPCRDALPHIREVAKKFQGQPLVILSVSLDTDQKEWKDFIGKHEMTWPQYCDNGFSGPVTKMFGVTSIPHTFTIDVDGVVQEEHVGDASIEGKLKKLLAQARELGSTENPPK